MLSVDVVYLVITELSLMFCKEGTQFVIMYVFIESKETEMRHGYGKMCVILKRTE